MQLLYGKYTLLQTVYQASLGGGVGGGGGDEANNMDACTY